MENLPFGGEEKDGKGSTYKRSIGKGIYNRECFWEDWTADKYYLQGGEGVSNR